MFRTVRRSSWRWHAWLSWRRKGGVSKLRCAVPRRECRIEMDVERVDLDHKEVGGGSEGTPVPIQSLSIGEDPPMRWGWKGNEPEGGDGRWRRGGTKREGVGRRIPGTEGTMRAEEKPILLRRSSTGDGKGWTCSRETRTREGSGGSHPHIRMAMVGTQGKGTVHVHQPTRNDRSR